jgi:hypothetical protein
LNRSIVELITPHRTNTNYHETRKGGQGPVWAVAPLHHHHLKMLTAKCLIKCNEYYKEIYK